MAQTLTYTAVLAAGRKAYEEKRLSAQGPTPACLYRDESGCPCVVGSAMERETISVLVAANYNSSRVQLIPNRIVDFASEEDKQDIMCLQRSHDNWCMALEGVTVDDTPEEAHEKFSALLYQD